MKRIVAMVPLLALAPPAMAQIQGQPIVASGVCDPTSGVTVGDGTTARFACDSAVVVRMQRGTVLIQFLDKKGGDGRILGFAGTIEREQELGADPIQTMAVERLYLAPGATPVPTSRGTCFLRWTARGKPAAS